MDGEEVDMGEPWCCSPTMPVTSTVVAIAAVSNALEGDSSRAPACSKHISTVQ